MRLQVGKRPHTCSLKPITYHGIIETHGSAREQCVANIPQTIGNYRLEHELGRGATSQVWMGRHIFLHERAVAVKLLLSHDEESVLRFTREAELTSQLRHQHIIQIYDHATPTNSFPYTVMELVSGGSVRQRVEKDGKLPLREAITIFRQIGSALDYAHSRNIIHRDVSPGNILLDASGSRALLTDFGIARLPDQRHTSTDMIMGTPGFFSPEHARSATLVTSLSDLYGLGVILYFMLSGQLPWETPPQHPDYRFDAILPLGYHGVELPLEVEKIIRTMLAIDPQKRYPTASAAMEALDGAFARSGIVTDEQPLTLGEATAVRAINTAPSFQAIGLVESEVEQALAADLLREPFERSHARAEELRDPLVLARVLDQWSTSGRRREFRKQHLGRIVNLREVRSRNVYFYQLEVLLETRTEPKDVEEPDANAPDLPVQKEQNRWQVVLPPPSAFEDDPGRAEIIPGSERVIACPRCEGSGYELCPECKGSRRVLVSRPVATSDGGDGVALRRQQEGPGHVAASRQRAAGQPAHLNDAAASETTQVKQVLVPCTVCAGMGRLKCDRCHGEGRLVQRRAFEWSRRALKASSYDDLPHLDENQVRQEVELTKVYEERHMGGLKREWSAVPGLKGLIANVQKQLGTDTCVAMAAVTIMMVPYTEVRLDLGHDEVVIEGETEERRTDDRVHLVQIYGFENLVRVGSFAYDGSQKLLFFWSFLATIAMLLLLVALLLPIFL
ncbi:MAG: serine/threonine protein kinase [Chloroflexi bacterium]|nr:MAG: serine/threonine protein kinase [Chloroflexota bacterium]